MLLQCESSFTFFLLPPVKVYFWSLNSDCAWSLPVLFAWSPDCFVLKDQFVADSDIVWCLSECLTAAYSLCVTLLLPRLKRWLLRTCTSASFSPLHLGPNTPTLLHTYRLHGPVPCRYAVLRLTIIFDEARSINLVWKQHWPTVILLLPGGVYVYSKNHRLMTLQRKVRTCICDPLNLC